MKKQYLDSGKIVGTHGIKGEVRIEPWCDSPAFLSAFKKLYLDENGTSFIEVKSRPHKNITLAKIKGVDAIEAGSLLVQELLKLPERLSGERSVVSVGTFRAGTARNIVADEAEITGIMRTLGDEARITMRSLLRDACRGVANHTDVSVEIQLQKSYSGVVNHDRETDHVRRVAGDLLGRENVVVLDLPTMKTDDFGYFLLHHPGVYYHFGAGCDKPLHSPDFLPEAHTALTGAALHAAVLHSYLANYTER